MASFKSIEPSSENIGRLQQALNELDSEVQAAEEKITALTAGITALLASAEDSGHLRIRIAALCNLINYQAFDAMNSVNSKAEEFGANYVDESARAEHKKMHELGRARTLNS